MSSWHDKFIERGVVGLAIAAPLVFAAVPVWASSLLHISAFIIFGVWLHQISARESVTLEPPLVLFCVLLYVVIAIVQLIPIPAEVLGSLSPAALRLRKMAGVVETGSWYPISLHPEATLEGIVDVLSCFAVFVVVVDHFRTRRRINLLVRTIVITSCLLVIIAVIQKATWNGRLYWFYPIDPSYENRLDYVWGPYLNRNHFAGLLEMTAPLALGAVMYRFSRIRLQSRSLSRMLAGMAAEGRLLRLTGYVVAFVLLSGTLFATLSRGGILGYAASTAVFGLLMRSRRTFRKWTSALAIVGICVLFVGLFASWDRIEDRFMTLAEEDHIARAQVWSDLLGIVEDYPLLGTGLGTFDRVFPRYQMRYATITFEHAENDYLEVLTDTGPVGLLLVLAAIVAYYSATYSRWKERKDAFVISMGAAGLSACVALTVHSMSDFNLRVPANAVLLSIVAGLTMAILGTERQEKEGSGRAAQMPVPKRVRF